MHSYMVALLAALSVPALPQAAPSADWHTAVIDPCETEAGFAWLPEPFEVCDLRGTEAARHAGRSVQWAFRPKAGTEMLSLSHGAAALSGPGAVSLWLKNPERAPLRLVLRLVEPDGSAYGSEAVDVADQAAWRELAFLTDDCRLEAGSSDENGALDLPPARLELVVSGVDPGRTDTLYLDELAAHVAPPEKLTVVAVSAPEAASAGQEIEARVTVKALGPLKRPHGLTLALAASDVVVSEAEVAFPRDPASWSPDELVESRPVRLRVPPFAAGGDYRVALRCGDLDLGGSAAEGAPVRVGGPMPGSLTVEVADHNGAPTVVANGEPISLFARSMGRAASARAEQRGGTPPLLVLPATADHDPYGMAPDVWLARDRWDYRALDRSIISVLDAQPEGRLILRAFLCAPDWWDAENPNELMLFGHGRHAVTLPGIEGGQTYPSFASEGWRADAGECLRGLVAHVESAPYADRVIGYWLAAGEEGRWRYWGSAEGLYPDYSRPQQMAFVAWLREKYGNDIRKLRGAWQEIVNPLPPMGGPEKPIPTLSWEDIQVPALDVRTDRPSHFLHDPAAAPETIDYNLFHARQVATTIAAFAQIAKEACGRRKLVGVTYGQLLDLARSPDALQTSGHLALGAVLADDNLDFIASPSFAGKTQSGAAVEAWGGLAQSVRAHRKVWIEEPAAIGSPADWPPVARALAGTGAAVADWPPRALAAARASLDWDRASVSDIAVIVDDYSVAYLAQGKALSEPLLALQQLELAQVGAPVDVWLLDDLIAGRVPAYKLYVVVDGFVMDAEARKAVRDEIACNGQTALWVYAPGALDETMSGRTSLDLTDIAVAFVPKVAPLRVTVIDPSHPLLDGVPKGLEYGSAEPAGPVFFALPVRAEPLGSITVPSLADGKPQLWAGLLARELDEWTSVYSAAPNVPAAILRSIARKAGVHLYLETGDVVVANASLVGITATSEGEKRVKLPGPADVRDVLSGEAIATGAMGFTIAMRAGETRLFYIGEADRWGL